ncbi:SOS response-associated peptidase [Spiribacter pallidus]|jgi:putative SOS response-associated peptidase YedK|uniref:SOS response-associated peptidase n=1 Tax=Spiribacter pallidus TaxID=1987936 RepID=UPI0034A01D4F
MAEAVPMCGRFALHASGQQLAEAVGAAQAPAVESSFNIPPGTAQWVTHADREGGVVFETLGWGYRPVWAGEDAPQPINARAEKVATSAFFRDAFARYRCLVPASGWFEWQKGESGKTPFYITAAHGPLFFAGIYDPPREHSAGSFAIITQPAAAPIRRIHPRMPLVLDPACYSAWLDPDRNTRDAVKAAARALTPTALKAWPVDTRVNRPANDDPGLIEPVADSPGCPWALQGR